MKLLKIECVIQLEMFPCWLWYLFVLFCGTGGFPLTGLAFLSFLQLLGFLVVLGNSIWHGKFGVLEVPGISTIVNRNFSKTQNTV